MAIRAGVCERREEGVEEVAVRPVDLYEVDCVRSLVSVDEPLYTTWNGG